MAKEVATPEVVGHQEGSRWINRRPTGQEVADWFEKNVSIHEGLSAEDYVGGVVLIGSTDKQKVAKVASGGTMQFVQEERYAWTPYAKVETRVKYFWDLMALHSDWVGVIEPVDTPRLESAGVYNLNLPPGFYRLPVQKDEGKFVHFLGCSMRVRILRADSLEPRTRLVTRVDLDGGRIEEEVVYQHGIAVAEFPPATKVIAVHGEYGKEDPFAPMKAETGAVGRALGMAGMLVIPGSGIATAEDMHEVAAGGGGADMGEAAVPPSTPIPVDQEADVRDAIQAKIADLQSMNPEGYEKLAAWAKERKVDLEQPRETQLRGLALQVERLAQ